MPVDSARLLPAAALRAGPFAASNPVDTTACRGTRGQAAQVETCRACVEQAADTPGWLKNMRSASMAGMFDSVHYGMYATVDDAIVPAGTLARISFEECDDDIAYRVDVLEPFDLRVVEDEAGCFNPVDPVGLPPVWLLVRGDEAPRPGMPCLTLAVTALDGADEEGEVHAAVETGWPKKLPEGALNGARFALWVLRDLLDGGSQEC